MRSQYHTTRMAALVGLTACCGAVRLAAQPIGTFRIDQAVDNVHTNEVSAAAAWIGPVGSQSLHVVVAWNDNRSSPEHLGVAVTTDGFASRTEYAFGNSTPPIQPVFNTEGFQSNHEFDPMTAVDPLNGDLYVGGVWGGTAPPPQSGSGIFVGRKPAGQTSSPHFPQVVNVIRDPNGLDFGVQTADKPWMTVGRDPNDLSQTRIYIGFNQFTSNDFLTPAAHVAWSSNQGQTWTVKTLPVPHPLKATGLLPRVGPDGTVYICMFDEFDGKILLQKSTDGGQTFEAIPKPDTCGVRTMPHVETHG